MRFTAIAIVSLGLLVSGCSTDLTTPRSPSLRSAQRTILSGANAELFAASQGRTSRAFEDEILRMELRIPGLGGVSRDENGNAVIYLKDLTQTGSAILTLKQMAPAINVDADFRGRLGAANMVVRQGSFAFSELVAWEHQILRSVRVRGFLAIDADEALNRVRVVMTADASQGALRAAIEAAGVPDSAIAIEVGVPAVTAVSLRDHVRPTLGGLQIMNSQPAYCTLGFNVDVQFYAEEGFLTASHCDGAAEGSGGTGDIIYQNTNIAANEIGVVSLNPQWNSTDPDCSSHRLCTGADAMYVHSTDTTAANWIKRIESTSSVGTSSPGSLTINGYWSSISEVPFVYVGLPVYKDGRNTGLTQATISATCENVLADSSAADTTYKHITLCSDEATGATFGPGDSGGPIFYPSVGGTMPSPPYAIGVFWGGNATGYSTPAADGTYHCTSGCAWYFSEWPSIQTWLSRDFTP
jgi:hypothetical protein